MKKIGFLFFDLLFAFAISTILITIIFICTTFLTKQFTCAQEYEVAKQLLHETICDLEQGVWYTSKNITLRNTEFTVTNQTCIIPHTPLGEHILEMPIIRTTISWQGYDYQGKHIIIQRFYLQRNKT